MYPVSQAFQNAIDSNARRYYWTGVITTKGGQEYTFDNENIIKGSGYIARSCCGNSSLELGTVYASEMGVTLLSDIDRYTLEGAQVKVYFHLVLPNDTVETVPMGIFEVSEATRKIRCLEIKAYDYMLRFDKAFNIEAGSGTAYNYLNIICEECGVEMAQTQAQIAALPNGTETLGIYSSNDIESYRDLLYYVAQVLGSVAQINREGKLELLQYTDTPVCKIAQKQRYTSSYSDFVTRYTAISSTNMVTEEAEYYALDTDDGLTMNLGTNPLLQFGLKATRERLLRRVLNAIAVAQYVPFTSDTIGNPALDPMDCLVFSGGHADDTKITCITSITYKINGKHSLKCVGKNPKLSEAKSKNDKNISGLLNQVVENKTVVYDFTNIEPLTLDESDTEVLSIDYVSKDGTSAMFLCEVLLNISAAETQKDISAVVTAADGTVSDATISFPEKSRPTITVTYAINGSLIETFVPKQTVCDGEYILTLFYPITSVKANSANYFTMFLSIAGGSATIGEGRIKATVSGQGLVSGVADWNGRIKMADVFTPYSLEFFDASLKQLTDGASVLQPNVTGTAVTSTLPFIHTQFALMTVIGINERVTADETVETFTVNATYPGEYDGDFVEITTDGVFARKTAYTIGSEQAEIVSGSLEHLFVDTTRYETITAMEVKKC